MTSRLGRVIAGAVTTFVAAGIAVSGPLAAHATSPAPWEPDPNAVGTLTFYNSSGTVITSGSTNAAPFAAYAAGSTPVRAGDTSASLYFSNPDSTTTPAHFYTEEAGTFTANPLTTGPASIKTLSTTKPVNAGDAGDQTLDGFESDSIISTTAGYQNVVQIRMRTANAANQVTTSYDDADVMIDNAAHTWTQIYPATATGVSTSTTVSTAPASPADQGTSVTVTATITAQDATKPAGTVQFTLNGTDSGSPVTVNTTSETAVLPATTALPPGANTIGATFTPTATGDYQTSNGSTSFVVNPVATAPTTSGKFKVGSTVTCSEPTSGTKESASYAWMAGSKTVGSSASLKIPGSAYKQDLSCTATVSATGATKTDSATSTATKVGKGPALKDKKAPKLKGKGKVGAKEKVKAGKWSPKATSYSYQWLLNGKKIKHATKSSFKIVKKDKNKKLSCEVTASAKGYADGTATTKAIKVKK